MHSVFTRTILPLSSVIEHKASEDIIIIIIKILFGLKSTT